ncbi:hypothetical protein [Burkholderia phage FLC9]|nr:hypothetical protein [Burkholderia phage FLC9]
MTIDIRPRVICGFPGVGKTSLFTALKSAGFPILDSDSSLFDKTQFPMNYIEHIKNSLENGYWVLCSTHTAVRNALALAGIRYVLAVPAHKYLKDEYMQRYRERGSPEAFLQLMDAKWDEFMDDVWKNDQHGIHYGLAEGEFLDKIASSLLSAYARDRTETFTPKSGKGGLLMVGQPFQSQEYKHGFVMGKLWADLNRTALDWRDQEAKGNPIHPEFIGKYFEKANLPMVQEIVKSLGIHLVVSDTMNPNGFLAKFYLHNPEIKLHVGDSIL